MSQALGGKSQLVLDYETTFGTSPTPGPIGPMPFNKLSLGESRALNSPETITGNLNPVQPFSGNTDVSGDAEIPVDLEAFGWWLKAALGTEVSSVVGAGAAVSVAPANATEVFTAASHGLLDGQGITFAAAVMPTGLTASTVYYLRDKDANTFKVALSPGGAAVAFSTDGTAVTYTVVKAHVFKSGNTQPSLVVEKSFPVLGQNFLYNGVKVASLSLDFGGDGELTAKISLKGQKVTQAATRYNSGTMTTPGVFTRVGNFQAAIQEAGVAYTKATKLSLMIDMGLDDSQFTIGAGGIRGDLPQGIAKVSGSMTAIFDSVATYAKAAASTESSLSIKLTSGTSSLEFYLPEILFGLKSPGIEGPKGILHDLDFTGYYQNGDPAAALQVTLINTRATAY
jgi:hypothetical protein